MTECTVKPIEGVTAEISIPLDPKELASFVDFLINYADVFSTDYVGYWACGIRLRHPVAEGATRGLADGWLLCEMHDEEPPSEADTKAIVAQFRATGERKFEFKGENEFTVIRLDQEAAIAIAKALACRNASAIGRGADALDYDAGQLDNAVQMALLGSLVYG